jgi:hypothetical protein
MYFRHIAQKYWKNTSSIMPMSLGFKTWPWADHGPAQAARIPSAAAIPLDSHL